MGCTNPYCISDREDADCPTCGGKKFAPLNLAELEEWEARYFWSIGTLSDEDIEKWAKIHGYTKKEEN